MLDDRTIEYLTSLAFLFGASAYLRDRRALYFIGCVFLAWCETLLWCTANNGTDVPWWFDFAVNVCTAYLSIWSLSPLDKRSVIWSASFVALAIFDLAGLSIAPVTYWDGLWIASALQIVLIGTGVFYDGGKRAINRLRLNAAVSDHHVSSWRMVRRKKDR